MNLFTPNHVQLLNSCYPPSSALLTSGPDYSPKSQELSRLTYFASNHPAKLTKFGGELDKRIKAEARKTRSGNLRSRASLLISLSILRSLATECRRDISLLSPFLIASVDATLKSCPSDLEVVARSATVFTAWTTYTDGHLIGTDSSMTKDYLSILRNFASLACSEVKDTESRNRNRLVGLSAITGALNSEALYNDSSQFKAQVSIIMRPILKSILQTPLAILNDQAAKVQKTPTSPYLAEFRSRPTVERRAVSIHAHIDGETGPSTADVSTAAMNALFSLLQHANGSQLGYIMRSSFDNLDELQSWPKTEYCSWFAREAAEWAQYQYRYVVPTWTVERLLQGTELPTSDMHTTLLAMATTVLNSPVPLINLSTSDIISNLITLLLRKVAVNPQDIILPPLAKCIASLGSHVYYSDQIQDLAGELVNRLVLIELQGVPGTSSEDSRTAAIRTIIASLLGLMASAQKHDEAAKELLGSKSPPREAPSSAADAVKQEATDRQSRRTKVPADIWQDTLSLLCDSQYSVRADYSEGLVRYVSNEYPKLGDSTDSDGVRRARPLADGPIQHAATMSAVLHGNDHGVKFLNAIHAYIFILATTSDLGLRLRTSPSTSPAPESSQSSVADGLQVNVQAATPGEETGSSESQTQQPSQAPSSGRRSFAHMPRTRKVSHVKRLLERASRKVSPDAAATWSDYSHILDVLTALHQQLPIRGLLTGIPMLIALDEWCRTVEQQGSAKLRVHTIRYLLAKAWLVIGNIWDCSPLVELIEQSLSAIPEGVGLPATSSTQPGDLPPSRQPKPFPSVKDSSPTSWTGLPVDRALSAIGDNANILEATGLDRDALLVRLSIVWSPHHALSDPVERSTTLDSIKGEVASPLLKISPALMHIENISLASLTRSTRGVGVTDLREALEGRSSMSNPALVRPASISTLDHGTSLNGVDSRLTLARSRTKNRQNPPGTGDVKDMLTKLGIGKQANVSRLKSSFPKGDQRSASAFAKPAP